MREASAVACALDKIRNKNLPFGVTSNIQNVLYDLCLREIEKEYDRTYDIYPLSYKSYDELFVEFKVRIDKLMNILGNLILLLEDEGEKRDRKDYDENMPMIHNFLVGLRSILILTICILKKEEIISRNQYQHKLILIIENKERLIKELKQELGEKLASRSFSSDQLVEDINELSTEYLNEILKLLKEIDSEMIMEKVKTGKNDDK